ncbi:uncharacterized protein EV154DRAFT_510808 [Mucor mucedo]|uniref:uncharacterized protein n=1 Tax=Mucor mucedo TaxID=29922 RepID=UPI00221FC5A3|nr:uncharacterized protein EV154DRAFT_510808 [Mucor mucedo]KAI7890728.1 hypothetical protein EV154DRAFT_510808 [Mucor mucedo]
MADFIDKAQDLLEDIDMDTFFSDEEEFAPAPAPPAEDQTMTEKFANVKIYNGFSEPEYNMDDPVFLYRMFYRSFFPYKTYFHWLNYDITPARSFTHREFSFTLANDIYLRFKSFPNGDALKKEIERLQPAKIDIGAVYSIKPADKKTVSEKAFKPLEKEFVLDIDMTDYDDVRTCCQGGDICLLCWEFMTIAIKIIDASLRDDFGFEHIMWVYSGRRGVHCWVCDEKARKLDNENRKAIISFLSIIKGGSQVARKVRLPVLLHPSLERSFTVVEEYFKPLLLQSMGILDTPKESHKVLMMTDDQVKEALAEKWADPTKTAHEKWEMLIKEEQKKKSKDTCASRDIMFQYCYPRLDVKVSTNINHLLKSPFCVHPKTLKVCVPIKPEECESFNPMTVPTLTKLRQEIIEHDKLPGADKTIPDYKKTSLKSYVEYFDKFVKNMLNETIKEKRGAAAMSMDF